MILQNLNLYGNVSSIFSAKKIAFESEAEFSLLGRAELAGGFVKWG